MVCFMFKLCYLSICIQNDKEQSFCNNKIFKTDTLEIKLSRRSNTNNKQRMPFTHVRRVKGWSRYKKKQQKSTNKKKKTVQT